MTIDKNVKFEILHGVIDIKFNYVQKYICIRLYTLLKAYTF